MKKLLTLTFSVLMLCALPVKSEPAISIFNPQMNGIECVPSDYGYFQGYRAFWSYIRQSKPSNYPGYWDLVPNTYLKNGYTNTICKNVVEQGYGKINLKKKSSK
jgi:hypothetical protein